MGRYVLLIIVGAAGTWAMTQGDLAQSAETSAEREEDALARQTARSGLNAVLTVAEEESEDKCAAQVVGAVSPLSGTYETGGYDHGTYDAWLEEEPGVQFGFRVVAEGTFDGRTVTVDRLIRKPKNREGIVYGDAGDGDLKRTTPDGSEEIGAPPQVKGMGPLATDLDDDGKDELPYVRKDNQKIEMVDADAENQGDAQTLVPSSVSNGVPADAKTRLSTGTWDGSQESVFYANEDHETIYRVAWDADADAATTPEEVVSPSDGAQAMLGIDNIDDDDPAELVFADASQHVRYVDEPGGPVEKLANGGSGLDEGIGVGSMADLDRDGTASAVFINGSNNLRIVDADGTDRTIYLDEDSDDGAAKTPPTPIDLDGDGEREIAYMREEDEGPDVEYVEADGSDINTLCGISVDESAGLVSAR
ncbi:MAG: hypothetical protein BRD31_02080 [Bacteroidetes bacterium QH_2_64_26]|nr:MAG: hypothetical protein BRD31_02080 [Bacteroidetes bacterium QH_2_64_26]